MALQPSHARSAKILRPVKAFFAQIDFSRKGIFYVVQKDNNKAV